MRTLVPLGLALAGLASVTSADEASGGVSVVSAIQDSNGHARVLFKADSPWNLTNVAVRRATLSFDATGLPADRMFTLQIHPVTATWEAGAVGWEIGWSRAGGDFDDRLYSRAEWDLGCGNHTLRFDLTSLVKEIVEHGMFADGFILTVDPERGIGIPIADLARLTSLGTASLDIEYRRLGPIQDRRGE